MYKLLKNIRKSTLIFNKILKNKILSKSRIPLKTPGPANKIVQKSGEVEIAGGSRQ